jgi:hypothetical protein
MVDTVRTQTDLLTNLFQDGQAANSITAQDMRDLIVSLSANSGSGWAHYADSTYTSGSPLTIASGVRTKLTNDGADGASDSTYAEEDWWDTATDKVVSTKDGAMFDLRVNFKAAYASGTNVAVAGDLDIGGAVGIVINDTKLFNKGSGTAQSFVFSIPYFTGSTFVANGGDFYLTPTSAITVWDISISIFRTFKPQV